MLDHPPHSDAPAQSHVVRRMPCADGRDEAIAVLAGRSVRIVRASGAGRALLADELEASGRVMHQHLLPPVDHWTEGESLVVAHPHAEHTLADALAGSGSLVDGAAVTVCAPVLDAMGAAHAAGVTGISLAPRDIIVSEGGAPLLSLRGASAARRAVTPHWLAEDPAVASDVEAALRLLELLVSGRQAPEAAETALRSRDWAAAAAAMLAWATPVPLAAGRRPAALPAGDAGAGREQTLTRRQLRAAASTRARQPIIARLAESAASARSRIRPLEGQLRQVRRSVWVVGAAGMLALAGAGVILTHEPEASAGAQGPGAEQRTESAPVESAAVESAPTRSGPTEPAQVMERPAAPEASAEPRTDGPAVTLPVADAEVAAELLRRLEARERCLADGDVSCLDGVVQSGSLLHRDDAAGRPVWRLPADAEVTVDQQLGDAVIARVDTSEQPASLLAVSTEAGWMIREIWLR